MKNIPLEWIDKIFNCLSIFYGDRWDKNNHLKNDGAIYKNIWYNALIGLSYEDIKKALVLYKESALDSNNTPPHALDFFHVAKGNCMPPPNAGNKRKNQYSKFIALHAIKDIKEKTGILNHLS